MTTYTNWCWWTYILVDGHVASRGCILDLDIKNNLVTYKKIINFPEDGQFDHGEFKSIYDGIWVDPNKAIMHQKDIIIGLDNGHIPNSFIKLKNQHPKEYFEGAEGALSSYLPKSISTQQESEPD